MVYSILYFSPTCMERWLIGQSRIMNHGDDLTYKKQMRYVPGFFLVLGSVFIFLSIFLVWAIVTHIMYRDVTYEYGYDRPGLYIIFFISLIPVFLLELEAKFTKSFLIFPFIETVLLGAIQPMYILVYSVETGIGNYVAGMGILFQFIGIVIAVIFESLDKNVIFNKPQHQYILGNYHR